MAIRAEMENKELLLTFNWVPGISRFINFVHTGFRGGLSVRLQFIMLGFYRTTTAGQTTGLHVLEGFSGFQEYSPDYKFHRFRIVFQVFRNFPIVRTRSFYLLSTWYHRKVGWKFFFLLTQVFMGTLSVRLQSYQVKVAIPTSAAHTAGPSGF